MKHDSRHNSKMMLAKCDLMGFTNKPFMLSVIMLNVVLLSQGTLTGGESSVQFTSSYTKICWYKKVNCTKPSTSVSIHWLSVIVMGVEARGGGRGLLLKFLVL